MTYKEAVNFLTSLPRMSGEPTLARMTDVMAELGNPQNELRFIHIAGTNGKGSTATMIARMLEANGKNVGLFVSPYIYSFCERIQLNAEPIGERALARLCERLLPYRDRLTAFEAVTALGFLYFAEKQCDWVVLEVGLGGRFDATNVIDTAAVSVITHIDLDHTEILGKTVKKIAAEKCGIIREGGMVVTTPQQHPEALEVIRAVCLEKNATLQVAKAVTIEQEWRGRLKVRLGKHVYALGMPAHYQAENAATALSVAELLNIPEEARKKGLSEAKLPGRMEWRGEHLVLDGAHNQNGIMALCSCLRRTMLRDEICLILGMLPDKKKDELFAHIAPLCSRLIIVPVHTARGDSGKSLYRIAKKYYPRAEYFADVNEAIASSTHEVTVVCGSMYLLGEVEK